MWRIALAFVVLLAACGKDSGSTTSEILRGVEIAGRLGNIVLESDTLIKSDVFSVKGDDEPSLVQYACDGLNCTEEARTGIPLTDTLLTLDELPTDPRTEYTDIHEHRGVDLARYSVTSTHDEVEWTFTHYGAWLTHSAFETTIGSATNAEGIDLSTAYSVSFGDETGTNPAGDGVWEGVMLGNTRHGSVQPLRGDATIRFTFATDTTSKLAVDFSNIRNLATDDEHPGMSWSDIDVSDGAFELRNIGHIAGRFYGDDHAEVGGVFTHPTALGAFGARKQ